MLAFLKRVLIINFYVVFLVLRLRIAGLTIIKKWLQYIRAKLKYNSTKTAHLGCCHEKPGGHK